MAAKLSNCGGSPRCDGLLGGAQPWDTRRHSPVFDGWDTKSILWGIVSTPRFSRGRGRTIVGVLIPLSKANGMHADVRDGRG